MNAPDSDAAEATVGAETTVPPGGKVAPFKSLGAARHAKTVVADLKAMDFKSEILPLDSQNISLLLRDFVFWSVATIGVVPLLLVTLNSTQVQLTGFCLFFAMLWGVIFKKFIVEDGGGWKLPIASLLFTGIVGINLLLFAYRFMPEAYVKLPQGQSLPAILLGSIFQTGICEELLKMVPVIAYLLWKRQQAKPLTIVVVGLFSGLGFAAFENMTYANHQIMRSAELTLNFGAEGLMEGVQGAMVNVLLRSMSLVFGHALFSGIFSYFVALGFVTGKRRGALFVVGLAVAATVHGCYNASWAIQTTLPAILTIGAFLLFYAYLTKLRLVIASHQNDESQGVADDEQLSPEPILE
jgi:RsiW-degrading membrane proteinase PrsW (M82 family)